MNKKVVITDEQELQIRRQADEVVKRVLKGVISFEFASPQLQAIVVGVESVEKRQQKKRDLAEERRQWFEDYYHKRGFGGITVPKPAVSNRKLNRRFKLNHRLFFRPPTKDVSYEAFVRAVGQASHWTVTNQAERAKIGWEPTEEGYWFWAEVQERCPRLGTCWSNLTKTIILLLLEEYMIVWHAHKAQTGKMLDGLTWTGLRTRYGQGALNAIEYGGEVGVNGEDARDLAIPYDNRGGRSAEVVKNVVCNET